MKHLSPGTVVDFARGLLAGSEEELVGNHLADCGACRGQVDFFRRVLNAAVMASVPPDLAEQAKRIFVVNRRRGSAGERRRFVARMVFENLGGLQVAGVRSVRSEERQALFRHEDYWISLRADREPEASAVCIVGQIGNERQPDTPVADVPVILLLRNTILASTRSNASGEFLIEFAPRRGVRLEFDLETGTTLEVPLARLVI